MPSIEDWVQRSWERFKRRWWELLGASGVAGAVALLGLFVPGLLGMAVASLGRWPVWAVSGVAGLTGLALALWFSTWAQAAAIEAAAGEGGIPDALRGSWRKTGAFAWTLSLVLLAAGGAFYILFLPGLWLTPLLFLAPFFTLREGVGGLDALETCWRRVSGRWGAVAGRLALAGLAPMLAGLIPILGFFLWLVAGPFSLVMLVVLAEDLAATDPGPARPAPRLALPVAALSVVFAAGAWFTVKSALIAVASLKDLVRL